MKKRLNLLREFSVPLLSGVLAALLWANLRPESYQVFINTPLLGAFSFFLIANDIFMVFFFGIAAVELTQSFLPGGVLNPLRKAVNPLLATLGGVLFPVLIYLGLNALIGSPEFGNGWGIATATDIALAWLVAQLIFGPKHPAVAFLLLLAIADDALGLLIIALFYPDPLHPVVLPWTFLIAAGMFAAYVLRRLQVRNYWLYLLLGGGLTWIGLYRAHLHPALALVFVVPFMPHPLRETKGLFEEDPRDASTLARFEHEWKVIVDCGLFLFGLANAGVHFTHIGRPTVMVFGALLAGKSLGVLTLGLLGMQMGFPLPHRMKRRDLLVVGIIAGIGFTVALFIAGVAFVDPAVRDAAKMGAVFSLVAAPLAWGLARALGIRRLKG